LIPTFFFVDIQYLSLSLTDPTLEDQVILTIISQGKRENFPPVIENYMIIIKNIKVSSYFKNFRLVGDEKTHFAIFSINSLKELPPYDDGCILKFEDYEIVNSLGTWIRGKINGIVAEAPKISHNLLQSSKQAQLVIHDTPFFFFLMTYIAVRNLDSLPASSLRDILKSKKLVRNESCKNKQKKNMISLSDELVQETGKYLINASVVGFIPKNVLNWVRWWCSACGKMQVGSI
jgi:hypothetical protein